MGRGHKGIDGKESGCVYFYSDKRGEYACFSQFFPCTFSDDNGVTYDCAEQFMMASKARCFGDEETLAQIIASGHDPASVKRLGRQVHPYDDETWARVRLDWVSRGNFLKFGQNPAMRKALLSTGDRTLVEAAGNDAIWGIGINLKDAVAGARWRGLNLLGQALMRAREAIRNGEEVGNPLPTTEEPTKPGAATDVDSAADEPTALALVPVLPTPRANAATASTEMHEQEQALTQILQAGVDRARPALEIASKLLKNVLDNPAEAKYRAVKMANAKLQQTILSLPGGCALLKSVGFQDRDDSLVLADAVDLARVRAALIHVTELIALLAEAVPQPNKTGSSKISGRSDAGGGAEAGCSSEAGSSSDAANSLLASLRRDRPVDRKSTCARSHARAERKDKAMTEHATRARQSAAFADGLEDD